MTDLRKAAEMALEALEEAASCVQHSYLPDSMGHDWDKQIEALRQALAEPKREWVGLTEDEVIKCFDSVAFGQVEDDLIINKHVNIFRAIHGIEARLKEKNA